MFFPLVYATEKSIWCLKILITKLLSRIAVRQHVFLNYEVEHQRYCPGDTCLFRFGACDQVAVGERGWCLHVSGREGGVAGRADGLEL